MGTKDRMKISGGSRKRRAGIVVSPATSVKTQQLPNASPIPWPGSSVPWQR